MSSRSKCNTNTQHTLILTNVLFTMFDSRCKERDFKRSKGVLSMCCFGAEHFLIGHDGKLWRLKTLNTTGNMDCLRTPRYKFDWPLRCDPNRLELEIQWFQNTPMTPNGTPFDSLEYDSLEYYGACHVFLWRGRNYDRIHKGRLENLTHLLIRIQRWTRRMLRRARALALSMALHPRLGVGARLAELGEDILQLILV